MEQKNLMEINSPNIGNMDSLGEYQRLYINDIIGKKLKNGLWKHYKYEYINCKFDSVDQLHRVIESDFNYYQVNSADGYIIEDNFIVDIVWKYESSNMGYTIHILSDSLDNCDKYIQKVKDALSKYIIDKPLTSYEVIQYKNNEQLSTILYKDTLDMDFNPIALPFIEDVYKYVDNFLNSKSPVLILQGAPGTGKTIFSKYILSQMQKRKNNKELDVIYSFDESILHTSEFFNKIIFHDYDVLVLEDFNTSIHKNQDDRDANPLNKFLSITDGLISKYKKIIITTNIESRNQLQPALIRPGRCFDVLNFRNIEGVEIDDLCDSCAKDLNLQTESINLSEFYAKYNDEQNSDLVRNRVGF